MKLTKLLVSVIISSIYTYIDGIFRDAGNGIYAIRSANAGGRLSSATSLIMSTAAAFTPAGSDKTLTAVANGDRWEFTDGTDNIASVAYGSVDRKALSGFGELMEILVSGLVHPSAIELVVDQPNATAYLVLEGNPQSTPTLDEIAVFEGISRVGQGWGERA